MKHLDLCSGIGGFALAARWAGFETVQFVEIDKWCQKILKKHWPDVPCHDDLKTFKVDDLANLLYDKASKQQKEEFNMAAGRKNYDGAVEMYNQGFSIGEAAAYYEISRQAMWKILQRRDVVFRDNLKYGEDNHFYRATSDDDRAQNLVEQAINKGILVRKACEICGDFSFAKDGRSLIHAHHGDYNQPLKVRWLCQKHHHEWHKHNRAIPKEKGGSQVSAAVGIDILTAGYP